MSMGPMLIFYKLSFLDQEIIYMDPKLICYPNSFQSSTDFTNFNNVHTTLDWSLGTIV